MAFFFAVVYAVVLLSVLFFIRLCVVVKLGRSSQPGKKGSVAAVVVAGSGNVTDTNSHHCGYYANANMLN